VTSEAYNEDVYSPHRQKTQKNTTQYTKKNGISGVKKEVTCYRKTVA